MRRVALLLLLCPMLAFARHPKPCVTAEEATKLTNKDVCVTAHVYDVVQLTDGTRYLDVCPPDMPDAKCRFTIVSANEDRSTVGKLRQYRGMDVRIRGTVRSMHGRAGLVLSHARQFHGGPPRFRPNPKLLQGFSGERQTPPVNDPGLRVSGGKRSFMNRQDQMPLRHATTK